jgi:creatinine deaminase
MKRNPGEHNEYFMKEAYMEAKFGQMGGGIPIGSILVINNKIVGRGHDKIVQNSSPTLHATLDCLNNAGRLTSADYDKATLYTTMSPCDMCAGAILLYKIKKVVIGDNVNYKINEDNLSQKGIEVVLLENKDCEEIMLSFIKNNPDLWFEHLGVR